MLEVQAALYNDEQSTGADYHALYIRYAQPLINSGQPYLKFKEWLIQKGFYYV